MYRLLDVRSDPDANLKETTMTKAKLTHRYHETDTRKTIGGYYRTACGRWASWYGFSTFGNRTPCPKCEVLKLIDETAPAITVEG